MDEQYDYGLDEGESFEPLDEPGDDIDVSQPHIMTLLGPIDPGALGIALHHEHIFNHTNPLAVTDDDLIIDESSRRQPMSNSFGAGGRALVDMGPVDYGRSITDLLAIAAHSPVHILVTTGHHKHLIAAPFVGDDSVDAITARNIVDIRDGIDGTTARAGLVKAGTSLNEITETEQRVLKAAAATQDRDRCSNFYSHRTWHDGARTDGGSDRGRGGSEARYPRSPRCPNCRSRLFRSPC